MRFLLVISLLVGNFAAWAQADSVKTRVILVGDAGELIKGQASVLDAI
jgi:hypothetical protein